MSLIQQIKDSLNKDNKATLYVKVKVNAKISLLEEKNDVCSYLSASVKAEPMKGRANAELIGLIADLFSLSKSCVYIKSGQKSKLKLVVLKKEGKVSGK